METPVFDPKTPFLPQKQSYFDSETGGVDPNLFLNYFCKIFASLVKPDISKKCPNYSKTRKNKKFGKFCLLQGLSYQCFRLKILKDFSFFLNSRLTKLTIWPPLQTWTWSCYHLCQADPWPEGWIKMPTYNILNLLIVILRVII